MGTVQTAIQPYGQPIAFQGLVTHLEDSESLINKEASLNIGFGLGVKGGTLTKEAKLPTSNTDKIRSIIVQNDQYTQGTFGDLDASGSPPGITPNSPCEGLKHGRCWVEVEAGITISPNVDRGYCRAVANGGNSKLGAWTNAADGSNTIDCTTQVLFVSAAYTAPDGKKIAEVFVNFGNK